MEKKIYENFINPQLIDRLPPLYVHTARPLLDRIGHSEEMHDKVLSIIDALEQTPIGLFALEHVDWLRPVYTNQRLNLEVDSIHFDNPTGLAAGWTKDGLALEGLGKLGFGFLTPGAVLREPQDGNPKPRQFAQGDKSVNNKGLPSKGMVEIKKKMDRYQDEHIPWIVNIANNHDDKPSSAAESFAAVAEHLKPHANAYEICICPNRSETGSFLEYHVLKDITDAVVQVADGRPVYLKTWPLLNKAQLEDFMEVYKNTGLRGFNCSNAANTDWLKDKYPFSQGKEGSFSGNDPDFQYLKLPQIAKIHRELPEATIIATGGISQSVDGYLAIRAGANLIGLNTGLRGQGLTVANQNNRGYIPLMDKDGFEKISDARGVDEDLYPDLAA